MVYKALFIAFLCLTATLSIGQTVDTVSRSEVPSVLLKVMNPCDSCLILKVGDRYSVYDPNAPVREPGPTQEQRVDEATELMFSGQEEKAFELFDELYNEYPGTLYRVNRGTAAANTGRWEIAKDDFVEGCKVFKENAEYHYCAGQAFRKLNLLDSALWYYNQAITLDAGQYHYYESRGTVLMFQKKWRAAASDFSMSISLNDDGRAGPYRNRGLCYLKLDEREKGCEDLHEAVNRGHLGSKKTIAKYCTRQ